MEQKRNPIISYIRSELWRKNGSFFCCFMGTAKKTGSGKSFSAITMARAIQKNWSIDNLVFYPDKFLALVNSERTKRGSVIVFDEAGVGIPARQWMTIQNKLMGYVFQTIRHRNFCIIMTTPSIKYIDSQLRELFNAEIETITINRKEEYVKSKFFFIEHNARYGKTYRKYPRIRNKNGELVKVHYIRWSKPPKEFTIIYEKRKKEFTKRLYADSEYALKDIKENNKPRTIKEPNTVCIHCDHKWYYKGSSKVPTCPHCSRKTTTKPN